MDAQKEALRRIISTLTNKNQELRDFLQTLDLTRTGLQEESCRVTSELEAELEQLSSALEERGVELRAAITQCQLRTEAALEAQQTDGRGALASCEELLTFADSALNISDEEQFLHAAKLIKERVTMAPAFRLSLRPLATENMSRFAVDFSTERAGLHSLSFLPVPEAPLLDASCCFAKDNAIFVQWSTVDQSGASFELQYMKSDHEARPPLSAACWEKIQDIKENHTVIFGLRFDSRFVVLRVRARNKAAAGDFSEPLFLETSAFHFQLDAATAHPELTVQDNSAIWGPSSKGHDPRVRSKDKTSVRSATPSPSKNAIGRASRDRFAGESYTVLGDQEILGGGHYWEVRPMGDWKAVSVGVAYRGALSRFVQLGKSPASWSLSLSQWLQPSVSAKHNNRSKSLPPSLPRRVGVYCHHSNGDLLFVDVDQTRLIHSFKTRFSQSLVPAFTVWCGGVTVETGLQVPSFMDQLLPPEPTSLSTSNQDPDPAPDGILDQDADQSLDQDPDQDPDRSPDSDLVHSS